MSAITEPTGIGLRATLHQHALRLHRATPDGPLPGDGAPYPDANDPRRASHQRRTRDHAGDYARRGQDVAALLEARLARPLSPAGLRLMASALAGLDVPIHRDRFLAALAARHDPDRIRTVGRHLVRHGTSRSVATAGLALLAETATAADIPLIRTIGLLSHHFGPLAAHALEQLPDGTPALLWLADRVSGWGRVYVVEALCRLADPRARPWLLRRAADGDVLNGYFAAKVARVAAVHEAIADPAADSAVVDHTGVLLRIMAGCGGMGGTLAHHPQACDLLTAYAEQVARLEPTLDRYISVRLLAEDLTNGMSATLDWPPDHLDRTRQLYADLLNRPGWVERVYELLDDPDRTVRRRARWAAGRFGIPLPETSGS
ncbi:hypothetical protein ACFW1A_04905 [Kitasatospora sp. NPDC058965]|uniref:hypothetical protein n=1 Tax=Kitasatospora sp. NPDC058965 TaxID=3346682 RepID=UPI0036A384AA